MIALASASPTRARILGAAGIEFEVVPAEIDEDDLKSGFLRRGMRPDAVAAELAAAKAAEVSNRWPEIVIGADQTLDLDGEILNKARDREEARRCLLRLRGRTHRLHSAAVIAREGQIEWRCVASVNLSMRAFSDPFLDAYLERWGESVQGSLGCYHFEGHGVQLFDRFVGDYHAILGLPLIRLLRALRDRGAAAR